MKEGFTFNKVSLMFLRKDSQKFWWWGGGKQKRAQLIISQLSFQ